ncbi:hypothetical protein CK203_054795 [Vitis vinifera]|uniref:Uncharacterized protein n=1 Tax=Vitis vinifera TaxID=29760 RepID=A0A438GIM4_VITVI|nr:hypothetical protein CK203_054795 [Vitis vinifera]
MTGIHPLVASHRLNILLSSRPVRQKVRRFHPDRQKIIRDEVDKLLEAGFIREMGVSGLAGECGGGPQKEGEMASMRRLYQPQQCMPKRQFPPTADRSNRGLHYWTRNALLPKCLLWIPPNPYSPYRRRKDSLHNSTWALLL